MGGRVLTLRSRLSSILGFRVPRDMCPCVCVSPRLLVCGKHSSIVDVEMELGLVQEILAPYAVFCCLRFNGAVSWMSALVQE